jgi:hypothetical protein
MWRCGWLALLLVVTACSRIPIWPATTEHCPVLNASTGLLRVHSDQGRQNLVVHRELSGDRVTYVALDAVGVPQFTAQHESGRLTVEQSPLYRGVDPHWLLWGWQWWQLREDLSPACVESTGYRLEETAEGWQLTDKGRPQWRWNTSEPGQFELPQQQARVTVREVEASKE